MHCVVGAFIVALVYIEWVLKCEGGSMEAMTTFLDQGGDALEKKVTYVYITPGSAIWVPPGYVPIAVGSTYAGDRRRKASVDDPVSAYIWHGMLCSAHLASLSAGIAAEIKSWAEKAVARNLVFSRGENAALLNSWCDDLKAIIGVKAQTESIAEAAEGHDS